MKPILPQNLILRPECGADRRAVEALVERAFRDVAQSDHTEHRLVARLRRSAGFVPGLSLVAVCDGVPVGYVLLSEVAIVDGARRTTTLGVAPLAVLPEYRRRGIGGALLREAHLRAAEAGYGSAVLLGHAAYYPRFGYRRAGDFGIRFPFDAPDACCMAVELRPGALEGVHGRVEYPAAFFE